MHIPPPPQYRIKKSESTEMLNKALAHPKSLTPIVRKLEEYADAGLYLIVEGFIWEPCSGKQGAMPR
jgi:hypothetical protein